MAPMHNSELHAKTTLALNDSTAEADELKSISSESIENDDRFPGSFFRIPGVPSPGKTTWSLVR